MRYFKTKRRVIIAFCIVCTLLAGAVAVRSRAHKKRPSNSSSAERSDSPRPRLVLLIVVDQFRYDYLERFGDLFVANGIKRLLRDGASWTDANYGHTPTYTAPAHATMMTGTWPSENGIVGNNWFDRETGKRVSSVTDDTTLLLGGRDGEKGSSPRRLMASTLGDEMRLFTNDRTKVIGISHKNNSAILPAGRHANAAYWFSAYTGNMVSSTYYFSRLPAWVDSFNKARMVDKFFGTKWERLLPEVEYSKRAGADAPTWEDFGNAKDTRTFPHIVTGGANGPGRVFYNALDYTPFSNDVLLSFAKQTIISESLGADADTDLFSVSFSGNDYVGHRFGPYSHEAMDVTLRVDRQIAELLDEVESRVGLQNTIVVFTADHGVAPIPAHAVAINLPGRRILTSEVLRAIKSAIKEHYGQKQDTNDYIQKFNYNNSDRDGFINGNLYFNNAALKRDGIDVEEFAHVVGVAAQTVQGSARFFTRRQLESGAISTVDPIARRVLNGFYPQRSGDVLIIFQPFSILVSESEDPNAPRDPATHGSPYSYDTHVPLIIMGNNLKAGRYLEAATPADIAPTLASILRIQAPSSATGRVLSEAFTK